MLNRRSCAAFAGALMLVATAAWADINIGVTLSATGPAASLGIPEKSTFELLPNTIAGEKINLIVLDDASDTTRAVTNTRKLISEDKADVIIGSTTTPNSLAMIDVVAVVAVIAVTAVIAAVASDIAPPMVCFHGHSADGETRRRMGAAGRAAVEQYYNWDRVVADLIAIDQEFRAR